jgi:isocitrate dehydrogenase
MFEAIHGSAPDIAGQNIANPSGLILAGVMMLVHLGQNEAAARIHNAWLKTVEDGVGTGDMSPETETVGTSEFAAAVIARLGQTPRTLAEAAYDPDQKPIVIETPERPAPADKALVGVDVFTHHRSTADKLAARLNAVAEGPFELVVITNRGVKVWPQGLPETFCTDHWRCRFEAKEAASTADIARVLAKFADAGIDVVKTENLYTFDGERGYSLGQGQ